MSANSTPIDPVELAAALIRRPSVTPQDAGALDVLAARLEALGFACHRLTFDDPGSEPVANLYARWGSGRPNLCFAGHTDVVPTGPADAWSFDPFAAALRDGALCGRGAVDMKGAIAAFVAAVERFLAARGVLDPHPNPPPPAGEGTMENGRRGSTGEPPPPQAGEGRGGGAAFTGSISLLITGDEEGIAVNGTKKVLGWLRERGEVLDACVVGEPTSAEALGDMVKIGRRGSMTGRLTVSGVQGHVAYPHLVDNAAHRLVALLGALTATAPDAGTRHFQPSSLQITTIDIGNPATNIAPGLAHATFNIRFNDSWSSETLKAWVEERLAAVGGNYRLAWEVSGESFLVPPGVVSDCLTAAIAAVTGRPPDLSTTGGTSDARFIHAYCPVAEFGLVGRTMHKADERVDIADLAQLAAIYEAFLDRFFETA